MKAPLSGARNRSEFDSANDGGLAHEAAAAFEVADDDVDANDVDFVAGAKLLVDWPTATAGPFAPLGYRAPTEPVQWTLAALSLWYGGLLFEASTMSCSSSVGGELSSAPWR